jgi:hypothetical protein
MLTVAFTPLIEESELGALVPDSWQMPVAPRQLNCRGRIRALLRSSRSFRVFAAAQSRQASRSITSSPTTR